MLKYLRIAVTALCLTACVLLTALWVRSYWSRDTFYIDIPRVPLTVIGSRQGNLIMFTAAQRMRSGRIQVLGEEYASQATNFGFGIIRIFPNGNITPHWLLVLLTGAIASTPWINWRFSLRTLLIATTLVAVGLGIIVAAR